jgi:hypothetical protein
MSERDEAVTDPSRSSPDELASAGSPLLNQVQSILKDLHNRAFMAGRRYEQALSRGPGPGERRTNQRKRRFR